MSSLRRALPPHTRAMLTAAGFFALGALTLGGCASKEKSDIVVAQVGPRTITLDYFERKLNTMDPQFVPPDIQSVEGREKLLEVMIDKEVMALKAEELGMASDGQADQQAEQIALIKAVQRMRETVTAPAQNPSQDELMAYYEQLPRRLTVSYMLFDKQKEALEAKGLVEGGEVWRVVAERLKAGDPGPSGDYTLTMRYGTVADDMEAKVFSLPVGTVSDPIDSVYGWFLVRVDDVGIERVQPFDTLADKIRASVIEQKSKLLLDAFLEQVLEEYEYTMDEDVVQLVFDAFPEDVPLSPPPTREDMEPLNVQPEDLDRVLMSYRGETWTVRRFADFYDNASPYGRPRRERRIASFRGFLRDQAVRDLMPLVARDRGFLEDPTVRDEQKLRREQAIVTRLHRELIADEVSVSPEEVEEFWAAHAEEYYRPERREILAVIAPSENDAISAQIDIQAGVPWEEVVEKYCIESDVKQRKGSVLGVTEVSESPLSAPTFALESEGDLGGPTEIGPDQWLVLKLVKIYPAEQPELADLRVEVGNRVKSIKEEAVFREKVSQWRESYEIETYPEHLMKAVYSPVPPPSQTIPVRVGGAK